MGTLLYKVFGIIPQTEQKKTFANQSLSNVRIETCYFLNRPDFLLTYSSQEQPKYVLLNYIKKSKLEFENVWSFTKSKVFTTISCKIQHQPFS